MIKNLIIMISFCLAQVSYAQQVQVKHLKKHIYYLADDKMQGRATGSKELDKAADYIEKHFKKFKLKPLGTNKYRQAFEAKVKRVPVPDSIRTAENIIGFLDNGAPYTVVIGAHYDHLGHGTFGGSLNKNDIGKIHNGADDNASGVAGLLELARYYSTNNIKEDYNILFIAFSAEELGLVGSRYWTENPTLPLDKIHWMLNMDMIGRYNPNNGLAIIGHGTSSKFSRIFEGITAPIKFYTSRDGNGGSDQTSFYRKNIPVLFFHTGGHDDYHRAGDDAHKIDYNALKAIIELEAKIINNSMKEEKLDFVWTN